MCVYVYVSHPYRTSQVAVAEACHANDFCGPLDQIGLRETIEEDRRWDFGESYLVMDRSMGAIVQDLSKNLEVSGVHMCGCGCGWVGLYVCDQGMVLSVLKPSATFRFLTGKVHQPGHVTANGLAMAWKICIHPVCCVCARARAYVR